MNPADSEQLTAAIRSQGTRLSQQEEQMSSLHRGMKELAVCQEDFKAAMSTHVNLLSAQVLEIHSLLKGSSSSGIEPSPPPEVAVASPVPVPSGAPLPLAAPEKFSGESGNCRAFIVDCEMHYEHLPSAFPTERSKVAFMVSHLTGRAREWATAEWSRGSPTCDSLKDFINALRGAFDPILADRDKARALGNLRQGTNSVSDYAIRFRALASECGWDSMALYDTFLKGLSDHIQDLLVPLDLPATLDSLITLAIRTDNRLQERKRSRIRATLPADHHRTFAASSPATRRESSHAPPSASWRKTEAEGEEPMQLGPTRLSAEERRRRLQEGRCFYCGQQGHLVSRCPAKEGALQ